MSPGIRDMRGDEVGPDGLSDRERARAEAKTRRQVAAIARVKSATITDDDGRSAVPADDLDEAPEGATGRFRQAVERPIPEGLDDLAELPPPRRAEPPLPVGAIAAPVAPMAPIPRATDLILLELAAGAGRLAQLATELRDAVQRDTNQAEKVRQFLAMAADLRGPTPTTAAPTDDVSWGDTREKL